MAMKQDIVVVGTDGSDQSFRAVEWAASEAVLRGATLRILSVPMLLPRMSRRKGPQGTPETVADMIVKWHEHALASASGRAELEPGLAVETALLPGSPASALTEAADDASMLVVGSRGGGGFAALLLGSVSRHVATRAESPVVVVREDHRRAPRGRCRRARP
jgi:nucleotide-binding universal stress UspA family protein